MSEIEFTNSDIGVSILSYLTEGIYPDPRDCLREYVQNAVDAKANKASVVVHGDVVKIEDDGRGMTEAEMRDSVRLAKSDKDRRSNIGYKGIGIFSALNVADEIRIQSAREGKASELKIDCSEIRKAIEHSQSGESVELIPTINSHVTIQPIDAVDFERLITGSSGTLVQLIGLTPKASAYFKDSVSLSEYLENVIPLEFADGFSYSKQISAAIESACDERKQPFNAIRLELEVSGRRQTLVKPYDDSLAGLNLLTPEFKEVRLVIDGQSELCALIWVCLNKSREMFKHPHQHVRGVRLKKHGFTIGTLDTWEKYFRRGRTFHRRMLGEIVIVSPDILPNAARSDIEFSDYSEDFKSVLAETLSELEEFANKYQETNIAEETYGHANKALSEAKAVTTPESLAGLKFHLSQLEARVAKTLIGKSVKKQIRELIVEIQNFLNEHGLQEERQEDREGRNTDKPNSDDSSDHQSNQNETDDDASTQDGSGSTPSGTKRGNNGIPISESALSILEEMNLDGPSADRSARKLLQMYKSLSTISLVEHPTLMYIGTWAFWEVLGKAFQQNADADSYARLNNLITEMGNSAIVERQAAKEMKLALRNINEYGDANKHSLTHFVERADGGQLRTRMEDLEALLVHALGKMKKKMDEN